MNHGSVTRRTAIWEGCPLQMQSGKKEEEERSNKFQLGLVLASSNKLMQISIIIGRLQVSHFVAGASKGLWVGLSGFGRVERLSLGIIFMKTWCNTLFRIITRISD